MKKLLLVYHSQSGTTELLLKTLYNAVLAENEVVVSVLRAVDCSAQHVINADMLLIAASENCGLMSGGIKEFLDRVYYPLMNNVDAKPYGLLVSAGNDGSGAVRELSKYLDSLGMKQVAPALIVKGEFTNEAASNADELGLTLAAGLAMGIF